MRKVLNFLPVFCLLVLACGAASAQRGGGSRPSAPTGLVANGGFGRVTLFWNSVGGATGYKVRRSTVSKKNYAVIGTPTTPSFVDINVQAGTRYFYVVSAVSSGGESSNSTEVSAIPLAVPVNPAIGYVRYSPSTGATPLWTMDPNGLNQTALTQYSCSRPAFSPDGTEIAFTAGNGPQGRGLYVMKLDGSGTRLVRPINHFFGLSQAVDWKEMPDGVERIAYVDTAPGVSSYFIYLTNLAGTETIVAATPTPTTGDCTSPTFSADGSTLYYVGWPDDFDYMGADIIGVHYSNLFGTLVEDSRSSLVYANPESALYAGNGAQWQFSSISASNFGNKLLVEADSFDGIPDVYVYDLSNPTIALNLTSSPGIADWSPTWSPDDTKVAFSTRINGGLRTIATVPAIGGQVSDLSVNQTGFSHTLVMWRRTP